MLVEFELPMFLEGTPRIVVRREEKARGGKEARKIDLAGLGWEV